MRRKGRSSNSSSKGSSTRYQRFHLVREIFPLASLMVGISPADHASPRPRPLSVVRTTRHPLVNPAVWPIPPPAEECETPASDAAHESDEDQDANDPDEGAAAPTDAAPARPAHVGAASRILASVVSAVTPPGADRVTRLAARLMRSPTQSSTGYQPLTDA